jgi:hypothetical protein
METDAMRTQAILVMEEITLPVLTQLVLPALSTVLM